MNHIASHLFFTNQEWIQAGDVLLTRMIRIQLGTLETSVALRLAVKFHFKLGPEYDDTDFYVAAHHWAPLLISRNYEGSKGNRPICQFKSLLTRLEAGSYDCLMAEKINTFESCIKGAGVSILRMDERHLLFAQGPTNTSSSVRSYFEGITGDCVVHLREQILDKQNREPLAVPEAVSAASPLVSYPVPLASSPDLTPSAVTYQNYIHDWQIKFNFKRILHPKFLGAFQMLQKFYENFDAIKCATDPKVFLYPCHGNPRSKDCLIYGFRYRQLSMAVFCDHCCQREVKCRQAELHHQKQKLDDTNGKRTAADSRISFKSLSPGEKDVRMTSLAKDRKIYHKTAGLLQKELKSPKAKFKLVDCASGFRTIISKSFQTLVTMTTEEREEATQHIIKELIGLAAGEASDQINEEEATGYLMTEINNKGKQLSGKPTSQVDFTPAILQSAVVLYLRTKVGYKDKRELSPLVMPSPSTMGRLL
jgi:hypothetical protein